MGCGREVGRYLFQTHSSEIGFERCEILVRGEYGDEKALIKRSSRAGDLKERFKVREMSSISTLEFAWEHNRWGRVGVEDGRTYFCLRVAETNKLELLKWAREEKKCEWDRRTINGPQIKVIWKW